MNGRQSETVQDILTIECNDSEEEDTDKGLCEKQVIEPYHLTAEPEDETYGCISSEKTQIMFEGDSKLAQAIRKDSKSKTTPRINWPTREVKPISQYSDSKIACLEFPWLFPGGVGDIKRAEPGM